MNLLNKTVPAWAVVIALLLGLIGSKVMSPINPPASLIMDSHSMGKDIQITKTNPFTNNRQHLEPCYDHAHDNHFEC